MVHNGHMIFYFGLLDPRPFDTYIMFTKHVSEWATNLRAAIKTSIVVAIGKVVPHDKIFRFLYLLLIQYCLLQFLNDSPPYFAVEENTDDTTHSRQYIVLGC